MHLRMRCIRYFKQWVCVCVFGVCGFRKRKQMSDRIDLVARSAQRLSMRLLSI